MSCFEVLDLSPDASPAEIDARWRQLAQVHHPDRGGAASAFQVYSRAVREARRIAEARSCPECRGSGQTIEVVGFSQVKRRCVPCHGTGKKWPKT